MFGREGLNDGLVFVAVGASRQKLSLLETEDKQTDLLKPWMIICLICIVTDQAMPGIYERAGGNGMRDSELTRSREFDRETRRDVNFSRAFAVDG
jgi:hypothetical protein